MMLGFGLIIAAMVALNVSTLITLRSVMASVETTLSVNSRSIDLAKALGRLVDDEEQLGQKLLVSRDTAYASLLSEVSERFSDRLDSLRAVASPQTSPGSVHRIAVTHSAILDLAVHPESRYSQVPIDALSDSAQAIRARLDDIVQMNQAAIEQSISALQDSVVEAYDRAFLLTLAAILLTLVLAFIIARTITRPIETLQRATERVAAGRFETIAVSSHDEMASLAASFNSMSAKLRQLNEYKADMMYHIAHEMRVPLQSLYSAHYVLRKQAPTPTPDGFARVLQIIEENVDRISAFINQFLDLARMEAGKMDFRLEPTDMSSLVAQAIAAIQPVAERKEIRIVLNDHQVPTVMADREKILQVLSNLLSNAVKFTGKGGTVQVDLRARGEKVKIAVIDTGVGIEPDDLPHLFTKFFQAKSAAAVNVKGTGIGLALVKGIVEGHSGAVSAESIPGQGSTFTVELPIGADGISGSDRSSDGVNGKGNR
jgi:signal transduction histidine kinase